MNKLLSEPDLKPKKDFVLFALLVAVVSQFADYFSTIYALGHGAEEANPLVNSILRVGGYELFFAYKLLGVALFTALSYWSRVMAIVLAAPFLYISYHNISVALEMASL